MAYDIVVLSDAHHEPDIPTHPSYIAAIKFMKDIKPKVGVIIGDFADFQCFSQHHNRQRPLELEGKRYKKTCQVARGKLEEIGPFCDELYYTEGNHEFWTRKYVQKHPEMEGYIDWPTDFGLYELGIEWTEYNKLLTIGKINFTHGRYTNKYHARKHLDEVGDNIIYGHTHGNQKDIRWFIARKAPCISESIACLCSKNPTYMKGWASPHVVHGFMYIEVMSDGLFTPHFLTIINGRFCFDGHVWDGNT